MSVVFLRPNAVSPDVGPKAVRIVDGTTGPKHGVVVQRKNSVTAFRLMLFHRSCFS